MFCENCGKQIADDAAFCRYCGRKISGSVNIAENQENGQDSTNVGTSGDSGVGNSDAGSSSAGNSNAESSGAVNSNVGNLSSGNSNAGNLSYGNSGAGNLNAGISGVGSPSSVAEQSNGSTKKKNKKFETIVICIGLAVILIVGLLACLYMDKEKASDVNLARLEKYYDTEFENVSKNTYRCDTNQVNSFNYGILYVYTNSEKNIKKVEMVYENPSDSFIEVFKKYYGDSALVVDSFGVGNEPCMFILEYSYLFYWLDKNTISPDTPNQEVLDIIFNNTSKEWKYSYKIDKNITLTAEYTG